MSDHDMSCGVCEAVAIGNIAGAWYCQPCLGIVLEWLPEVVAGRLRTLRAADDDYAETVLSNCANWLAAVHGLPVEQERGA